MRWIRDANSKDFVLSDSVDFYLCPRRVSREKLISNSNERDAWELDEMETYLNLEEMPAVEHFDCLHF